MDIDLCLEISRGIFIGTLRNFADRDIDDQVKSAKTTKAAKNKSANVW